MLMATLSLWTRLVRLALLPWSRRSTQVVDAARAHLALTDIERCFRKQRSGGRCFRFESAFLYADVSSLTTSPYSGVVLPQAPREHAPTFADDVQLGLVTFGMALAVAVSLLAMMILLPERYSIGLPLTIIGVSGT